MFILEKIKNVKRKERLPYIFVFAGVILLLTSFGVKPIVNKFLFKIYPQRRISVEELMQNENSLKGFQVMEDFSLSSTEDDPWIYLSSDVYDFNRIKNVNFVISYASNISSNVDVFGIPSYCVGSRKLQLGDNYFDLTTLDNYEAGIRLDLSNSRDQYVKLDAIILNDYSYIADVCYYVYFRIAIAVIIMGVLMCFFSKFNWN